MPALEEPYRLQLISRQMIWVEALQSSLNGLSAFERRDHLAGPGQTMLNSRYFLAGRACEPQDPCFWDLRPQGVVSRIVPTNIPMAKKLDLLG